MFILITFNPRGMPRGVEFIFDKIPKPGSQPHQFDMDDVQKLMSIGFYFGEAVEE